MARRQARRVGAAPAALTRVAARRATQLRRPIRHHDRLYYELARADNVERTTLISAARRSTAWHFASSGSRLGLRLSTATGGLPWTPARSGVSID